MLKKKTWDYYIDASTRNMGLVLCSDERKQIIITSLNFSKFKPQDKDLPVANRQQLKLRYIYQQLLKFIETYPPDKSVTLEGIYVQAKYKNSSEMLLKLHGLLIPLFNEQEFCYIPPATIKKTITGNGAAKKDAVQQTLVTLYDIHFANEDESDAFALFAAKNAEKEWTNYTIINANHVIQ